MSSVKMIHCCIVTTWSTHVLTCMYIVYVNTHTNMCTQAHTVQHRHPLWILQRQQGKYLCFESITSDIFIFLSPCCYNFLPCQTNQNTKTKRRLRQRLRFSTVRFTGTLLLQTSSVQRDLTCVFVHLCGVAVHVRMCGWVRLVLCRSSGHWEQYN